MLNYSTIKTIQTPKWHHYDIRMDFGQYSLSFVNQFVNCSVSVSVLSQFKNRPIDTKPPSFIYD